MNENFLFCRTMRQLEKLFCFAGIYIRSERRTASRFKARCLYFLHSFAANYQLFSSICWCVNGLMSGDDFLGITYSIPCLTISILAQFKGLFLIKNEEKAEKLIANLKKLEIDAAQLQDTQSFEKDKIIKTEVKFLNFVLKTLNIFYVFLVAGFSISPLVLIVVKYLQKNELVLVLPFFTLYGFDPLQWPIWPFMYLHQCWSELAVVFNICSADYFFFTCCTYIRIQFKLLELHIENMIPCNNINEKFLEDEEFKKKFDKLIKWHQDLIESTNILEIIYSKSTLFNFISSSIIICLTGFNVTIVHDAANVTTFLSFLLLSLVQVFFVCFFADLMTTSSIDIGKGVYKSRFYMAEPKIGRKMLIVLIRSQKPCKITASGYADVNLNSFMRVLSTAWSYFALLQTMYDN